MNSRSRYEDYTRGDSRSTVNLYELNKDFVLVHRKKSKAKSCEVGSFDLVINNRYDFFRTMVDNDGLNSALFIGAKINTQCKDFNIVDPSSLESFVYENKVESLVLGCDISDSISLMEKCVVRGINKETGYSEGVESLNQTNTHVSDGGIISTECLVDEDVHYEHINDEV